MMKFNVDCLFKTNLLIPHYNLTLQGNCQRALRSSPNNPRCVPDLTRMITLSYFYLHFISFSYNTPIILDRQGVQSKLKVAIVQMWI